MSKKGICELCGFNDNSYSIEENGTVMKVCKFCHDGYLERMGIDPSADNNVSDLTLTLDLDSAKDSEQAEENLTMKVEPLTVDELQRVLDVSTEDKRSINYSMKKKQTIDARKKTQEEEIMKTAESSSKIQQEAVRTTAKLSDRIVKENEKLEKALKKRDEILRAVNAKINDERITITSPEVQLKDDVRPKSNLDVAVADDEKSVRFIEIIKKILNIKTFSIFAGALFVAVSIAMFITDWSGAIINLCVGIVGVPIGILLVWYLSYCFEKDKRTHLFRIKQQEILFASMTADSYRELKSKYSILRSLYWLLSRLSILLPLVTIVGGAATSVVLCFTFLYWVFGAVILMASAGAILTYYIFKFLADIVACSLDKERNQQIMQQTLLDILKETKSKK